MPETPPDPTPRPFVARALPAPMEGLDAWIAWADRGMRTLAGGLHAARPMPRPDGRFRSAWAPDAVPAGTGAQQRAGTAMAEAADDRQRLSDEERRLSGALMRVNHVGEVCAQALYDAQALTARDAGVRAAMRQAGRDETDHLAWTEQRLNELGARRSLLNPAWYAGAFAIGWVAGRLGDRVSLGFVVETERQVEAHLASHLERLPVGDLASRAVVEQMKLDEARHALEAEAAGALPLPAPVRAVMRLAAAAMTRTAHHI